jgi:hypothetical protein
MVVGSAAVLSAARIFAQEPAPPALPPPALVSPTQTPTQTPAPTPPVTAPTAVTQPASVPLAIVPVEGVQLSGALLVADGKASIGSSGSITAGLRSATVSLPHKGELRLCSTTRVSLAADKTVAANLEPEEAPGLMMALDRGALEANFATGKNSDVILTPDFRIVISGPGTAAVRVRLGANGDTCVDNRGPSAPYVTVSSVFQGGVYRVQQDQRVMFEHGSLNEVVDSEKESCGCPDEPAATAPVIASNPFPVAQSAGLAPLPTPPANANQPGVESAQATAELHYDGNKPSEPRASVTTAAPVLPPPQPVPAKPAKKQGHPTGIFGHLGHFFRNLFGG